MISRPVADSIPATDGVDPAYVAPNAECCYQILWQAVHPKLTAITARNAKIAHPYGSRGMKMLGSPCSPMQLASLLALVQGRLQMPQGSSKSPQKDGNPVSSSSSSPGVFLRGRGSDQSGCSAIRSSRHLMTHHCSLPSLHAMLKAAHQEGALAASCTTSDPHGPSSQETVTTDHQSISVSVFDEGKWVPGGVHGNRIVANVSNHPLLVSTHPRVPSQTSEPSLSPPRAVSADPCPKGSPECAETSGSGDHIQHTGRE